MTLPGNLTQSETSLDRKPADSAELRRFERTKLLIAP